MTGDQAPVGASSEQRPAEPLPPLNHARAARAEQATRSAAAWQPGHLRWCLIALVAAGTVLAIVGGLVVGASAVWGVLLGTVIVGLFFSLSTGAIIWVGRRAPSQLMWAALSVYFAKMVALGFVLVLLPRDGPFDTKWMAGAIGLGIAVWLFAHLYSVVTTKIYYVDPS